MSRHFGVQTSTARRNHRSGHTEGRLTTTPSGCCVRKGTPCGHSACIRAPSPVEAAPRVPQHPPDECPMRGRQPGQHTTPAFTRASAPAAISCAPALDDEQRSRESAVSIQCRSVRRVHPWVGAANRRRLGQQASLTVASSAERAPCGEASPLSLRTTSNREPSDLRRLVLRLQYQQQASGAHRREVRASLRTAMAAVPLDLTGRRSPIRLSYDSRPANAREKRAA